MRMKGGFLPENDRNVKKRIAAAMTAIDPPTTETKIIAR
jgi:hypothetical protein